MRRMRKLMDTRYADAARLEWLRFWHAYRYTKATMHQHLTLGEDAMEELRRHPLWPAIAIVRAKPPGLRHQLRMAIAMRHPEDIGLQLMLFGF